MENVEMTVSKKGILTIRVDLNSDCGQSKSGKSIVIASTKGNKPVPGEGRDEIIGLNVYRKC